MFTFVVTLGLLVILACCGQGLIAVILAIFLMPVLVGKWKKYSNILDEKCDRKFFHEDVIETREED